MKKAYNLKYLVSVHFHPRQEVLFYTYKPYKKTFWGTQEEGFYDTIGWSFVEREEILKSRGFAIENNVVYQLPYINLKFVNGENYIEYFKTKEEAFAYMSDKIKGFENKLVLE